MTAIPCDGCGLSTEILTLIMANAVQARYCSQCLPIWQTLETSCNGEAVRLQELLELFWREARSRTPLWLTPLDFPQQGARVRA